MKQIARSLLLFGSLALCPLLDHQPTRAQIASDGTLSTTVITFDGSNFIINDGNRAGSNLFHSFSEFSVPTNGSAFFNNAFDVQNIINRVTGGSVSNIDGFILANGSANLFLLNPAGIIFGPNASLFIGGSFLGSTADSLVFPEGEFSATDTQTPPLLSINAPIGLNFRDNPAPIENNSTASADFNPLPSFDDNLFGLRVRDGKSFVLAGGDMTANGGGIVAFGGRIELGAIAEEGTVGINLDGDNLSLSIPDDLQRADVSLTNGAGFLVSGAGGGDIAIAAQNINILENSRLNAGIFSGLGSPDARAGDIVLNALEAITVDSGLIVNSVRNNGVGDGGDINIEARSLDLANGGQVAVLMFGQGNTGNLTVRASESIRLNGGDTGAFSGLFAQIGQTGKGSVGDTIINTERLSINNGGQVAVVTFGQGNTGSLTVRASESIEISGRGEFPSGLFNEVGSGAIGNSGELNVETDNLTVSNGGTVSVNTYGEGDAGNLTIETERFNVFNSQVSTSTFGEGNAGNLTVRASDSIELSGELPDARGGVGAPGGLLAQVDLDGEGRGGNLTIETQRLSISDGSKVQVATFGQGDAGELIIRASE
ncbi:filamentous hemagglutinin N-terminal domain-containing protein, partial [Pleurocapsales cyanobacterium LEGE 06147]|nr:filamentous hemagglutinin N-terminal domain-containing protein [Pleurocapsales cyanobacterium LEGE 06147]